MLSIATKFKIPAPKRRSGSVLMWSLVFLGVVGIASLLLPNIVQRQRVSKFDDKTRLELTLLAKDVREIAKYLLLYEKIIYLDSPTLFDSSIKTLWNQNFGEVDAASAGLMKACGGYGFNSSGSLEYLGDQEVNGKKVFCPMYVRTHMMTTDMLEDLLFAKWKDEGILTQASADAPYRLTLDFTSFARGNANGGFLQPMVGKRLKARTDPALPPDAVKKAMVHIDFLSDGAGVVTGSNKRYMKISSEVVVLGKNYDLSHKEEEDFVMNLSTPKDFALFIPFPKDSSGDYTRSFTESLKLKSNHNIYGRTYFNGDIRVTKLEDLPNFRDVVLISGNLYVDDKPLLMTDASRTLMREKFSKGLITNFSASRFMLDGDCSIRNLGAAAPVGAGVQVLNKTGLFCDSSSTPLDPMRGYLSNLGRAQSCWDSNLRVSSSYQMTVTPQLSNTSFDVAACAVPATLNYSNIVSGGWDQVTLNGATYAFVVTPAAKFSVSGSTVNIYGTLLGGHVDADSAASLNFYSIKALRAGLPGIGSASDLDKLNISLSAAYEGVAVPLLNVPVVYSTQDGIQ